MPRLYTSPGDLFLRVQASWGAMQARVRRLVDVLCASVRPRGVADKAFLAALSTSLDSLQSGFAGSAPYKGLIATLRNLMTPSPCCRVMGPSLNRPLFSSTVFWPLS